MYGGYDLAVIYNDFIRLTRIHDYAFDCDISSQNTHRIFQRHTYSLRFVVYHGLLQVVTYILQGLL